MAQTHEFQPERESAQTNKPEFPSIVLDEKAILKLGFKELPPVGTPLRMIGRVEVAASSVNAGQNGRERLLTLQITHMVVNSGTEHDETNPQAKSEKLYGS